MPARRFKPVQAIKSHNLEEFIGRTLNITIDQPVGGRPVTVETIIGSRIKPTRFEINHEHWIVILDAYKQLNNDRSISPEQIKAFDESVMEECRPANVKDLISASPSLSKLPKGNYE